MEKQFYVYMMANRRHNVLYTGVTSDLFQRVWEHRHKTKKGFSARYNVDQLVYYEVWEDSYGAIGREKQIKGGSRAKKVALIEEMNAEWKDLAEDWFVSGE